MVHILTNLKYNNFDPEVVWQSDILFYPYSVRKYTISQQVGIDLVRGLISHNIF